MIRGFYSAASGLTAFSLLQDVTAENLAHQPVPGYKQAGVAFQEFETVLQAAQGAENNSQLAGKANGELLGNLPAQAFFNFDPGPLQFTGNPLDLAVTGTTFFVLDSPAGPVFTRNGSFRLNAAGELENGGGLRVRGEGGAITIPTGTSKITVTGDGFVQADGQQVGRLQLERIDSPAGLTRAGPSLFTGRQPQNQPDPGTFSVEQGFLEGSNVNVVTEMVQMIANLRFYDAAQRALRTLSEALALNTRPEA